MRTPLAAVALLLISGPAVAGKKGRNPLPPADAVHDFHTTDRLTPATSFGIELGFEPWDSDNFQPIDTVVGFDLGGHFVSTMGVGGYVVVPVSMISIDDTLLTDEDTATMLGNIEVGGLYALPVAKTTDVVFHLGVALPTASDDDLIDESQGLASTPRYGDLVQRWPHATYLRIGASPMGTFGPIFWRADLGLDFEIADDDDMATDISPIVRVNVAGGVDFGPVDATVELVTNVTNPDDDNADETASTLALGARYDGGTIFPGLALIFPVGFDDPIDSYLDLAIAVSLTARLPEK